MTIDYSANLLRHHKQVQAAAGNVSPAPPVMVDVDPCGACNLNCEWCCQAHWRFGKQSRLMPEHAIKGLPRLLSQWGVRSVRIAGEGEPTLSPWLSEFITSCVGRQVKCGLITNGVLLERVNAAALDCLSYLGVSVDAGTRDCWSALKQYPPAGFDRIVDNIAAVRAAHPRLHMTWKYLIYGNDSLPADSYGGGPERGLVTNDSQEEISAAQETARRLGVHFRLKRAYSLSYRNAYQFTVCRATPLGGVFCSNLHFQLCCDRRGAFVLVDDFTGDNFQAVPRAWGTPEHMRLIDSIRPRECLGCSKAHLNTVLENVVRDGPLTSEMQVEFV